MLLIGGEKVALWKAGSGRIKSVVLAFNDSTISFGTLLSKKGTLSLTVTNDADKSASSKVMLTDEAIMGLGTLVMQVDVEVNLLDSLKFARGVELTKTEIEFDGQRTEIADPAHFIPEYPGLCTLFFSVKKDETVSEVKTENLTINALEYKAMEINNIKPEEILPII